MRRIFTFLIALFVFIASLFILTACSGTVDPNANRPITVSDITIDTENVKTEIIAGEQLDLSALIVKTVMSDDSWTVLSEGVGGYTVDLSGFDNEVNGIYTVYITHGLFTKSFTVTVIPRLTGIEIADTSAQKTNFIWEEDFSSENLIINKIMSDGSKIQLSGDDYIIDFSAYSSTNPQNTSKSYTIKVTLKADSSIYTEYSVNVGARPEPIAQSIIVIAPDKTNYTIGESLNLSGGKVIVKHDWGEDTEINLSSDLLSLSPADTSKTSEQQLITVTYISTGFTATFKINVRKLISSISIYSLPTKLTYCAGDVISLAGGIINLNFNDGSISRVYMNDESSFSVIGYNCDYSTFNEDTEGNEGFKTATVTLKGYPYNVNFSYYVPPKITSLTWESIPSSTYFLGDPNYLETGVLKATYDDEAGTFFSVTLNDDRQAENPKLSISGFNTETVTEEGVATITLTDWNLSVNLQYVVRNDRPVTIVLIKEPDLKAFSGTTTSPDLTGAEVEITFSSGLIEMYTLPHADFTASSIGILSPGEQTATQTVYINYKNYASEELTLSYDITFTVSCTGFEIRRNPNKTVYKHNDTPLDLTGGTIAVSYDNNTFEAEINMTALPENYTVTGFDNQTLTTEGIITITDTNTTIFRTFSYSVVDWVTAYTLISAPTKLVYYKGDLADYSGAAATVTYSFAGDTFYDDITSAALFTITNFHTNFTGPHSVYVKYYDYDYTRSFTITVKNRVKSISLTTPITKTEYYKGDSIDPSGGILFVTYDFNLSSGSNTESIATDTTGLNTEGAAIGGGDADLTDLRITFPDFSTDVTTDSNGRDATIEFGGATTAFNYKVIKQVTGVSWNITPSTSYVQGDSINLAFASVYIVYDYLDNVAVNLLEDQNLGENSLFTIDGFCSDEAGSFTYTVTHKTSLYSVSLNYTVSEPTVTELELFLSADTDLLFGDEFDYFGVTFRRYFNNGTEDIITLPAEDKITASGFDSASLTSGTPRAITFTAVGTEVTNSITYTISDWVQDFIINTYPTKTVYYKDDSTIDLSGGTYHLIWASAGATEIYNMDPGLISSSGLDTTAIKTVEDGAYITLTYSTSTKTPLTATYIYTVKDKVASIALTTDPAKTTYYINQTINLEGGVITITYDFNEPETVALPSLDFAATLDTSTSTDGGTRAMTITHDPSGISCEFFVPVLTRTLTSITINTNPEKLTYYKNDIIELSGGILTLNYNQGEPDNLSMTAEGVSIFSGDTETVSASVAVRLNYSGLVSNSFYIEVLRSLESISINATPKTIYKLNDTLDITGGSLTLLYDDTSTETLSLDSEGVEITGFDSSVFSAATLTVTYLEKTTSYDIEVKPFIVSLTVTNSGTNSFVFDTTFNSNGLTISATYDYDPNTLGNPREIFAGTDFDTFTVDSSDYIQNEAGNYTIYVYWSYDHSVYTTYDVTVNQSEVIQAVALTNPSATLTGYTDETYAQFLTRYSATTFDITYTDNRTETSLLSNATSDYTSQNSAVSASVTVTFTYSTLTFTAQAEILQTAATSMIFITEPSESVFYEGSATEASVLNGGNVSVYYNNGTVSTFDLVIAGVVAEGITTNFASLVPGATEVTSAVTLIIYYDGVSLERNINYYAAP